MTETAAGVEPVSVALLDRDYLVACPPEQRDGLRAAAALLDGRMREIRNGNRGATLDRIAVLAALNFAHELSQLKQELSLRDRDFNRALGDLNQRLDQLLDSVAGR